MPQKLRVAFVSQNFMPEVGGGQIYGGIALGLRDLGYNVRVVTAVPHYPQGRAADGYRAWRKYEERQQGLPVTRVPLYPSHQQSALKRFANYSSFAMSATVFGRRALTTSDVNVVISSPATADVSVWLYRAMAGRPYVMSIQDLWPESIFATGFLGGGGARRLAEATLRPYTEFIMRRATRVLVITPSMKDAVVSRGVSPDRVEVMFNWVDESLFVPAERTERLRQEIGIPSEAFVFMYSGNLGLAQDLGAWVEAFTRPGYLPQNAHLVLQGDGQRREELVRMAAGHPRVHFLPHAPRLADAIAMMRGADAMVVSLADFELSAYTMPSKIPSALALGKAVVATVPGDAARVLVESGAGLVAPPRGTSAVAKVVRSAVREGRESLDERGQSGRAYYEAVMCRGQGLQILDGALKSTRSATPDLRPQKRARFSAQRRVVN